MISGNGALNIGALFTEVFGISSPIYLPWGRGLKDYEPGDYQGVTFVDESQAEAYSWMGTPVIGTFTLDGCEKYKTYKSNGSPATVNLASFLMPYATVVSFSRPMNVSKTKVLGTYGTVKEIYGLDDWNIMIQGFCIEDRKRQGYRTVAEQVNALCKFRKVTEAIGVTGSIFNDKEIYAILIEELNFNPVQGNSSVMPFTIRAISDTLENLRL